MGKKLTEAEFRDLVQTKFDGAIEATGYKGYRHPIIAKCLRCRNRWTTVAGNLCRGHGCPLCGKEKAKKTVKWAISQEEFLSRIPKDFLATIEVSGKYEHQHCEIDVRCRRCGRNWISTPYYLYRCYGCDQCARKQRGINFRKGHQEFVSEINRIHDGCIEIIGNYTTCKNRVLVRCLQCEHKWSPIASRLRSRGCPRCISSKGERKIERLLKECGISYKHQFGFDGFVAENGCKYRFDFAIFNGDNLSHLIEYDGEQHFRPVKAWGGEARYKRQVEIDKLKAEYCQENGLRLTRIPYTLFSKIDAEMLQ